jgi:hypothetical protein
MSCGQKKGRESNWQFDSRPLKIRNRPDFFVCRCRATYRWKALDNGYKFASNFILIKGLHIKLCAFKITRLPILGILGLPFKSPGQNAIWMWALWKGHKVYYKGEGGGFPQVWAVVYLVSPNLPVVRPSTKSATVMH